MPLLCLAFSIIERYSRKKCTSPAALQPKVWGSKWETQSKAASPRPRPLRFTESCPQCDLTGCGSSFTTISAFLACGVVSRATEITHLRSCAGTLPAKHVQKTLKGKAERCSFILFISLLFKQE